MEGITTGHWDAYVEAEEAALDFSQILRKIGRRNKYAKRALRMGLFLYCHSTEMSTPYEIIANLLRCCQDKSYKMYPFAHLIRVEKKAGDLFGRRFLPSSQKKITHIKELAAVCGEDEIGRIFDGFFRNNVRNAFYHSDYAIAETEFRIIKGSRLGEEAIKLDELADVLARCFAFYSAFFITLKRVRQQFATGKKFMKWPNYEVLELLSRDGELTGFKVHFPSGTHAFWERQKYKGTMGVNVICDEDDIQLMVGDLDKYRTAEGWKVDGKLFDEYGTRYNRVGYWRPIVFLRDSESVQRRAVSTSKDKVVQGCLFYIYATGHKAIEFVIKSDKNLFSGEKYVEPRFFVDKQIEIHALGMTDSKKYLYDGTYFLKSDLPEDIKTGTERIKELVARLAKKNEADAKYRLKYQLYADLGQKPEEREENGKKIFTISISMDDPRSTLVTNNLKMFPRTDWRIKEVWI